jgi:hypothetical protein
VQTRLAGDVATVGCPERTIGPSGAATTQNAALVDLINVSAGEREDSCEKHARSRLRSRLPSLPTLSSIRFCLALNWHLFRAGPQAGS